MAMKKVRGGLFIFIALVVWLPLLNYWFGFIESGKLNGVSPEKKLDKLSWNSWWTGKYQEQRSDLMNDSLGLRPDLVRMTNQLDYSLFHKINGSNTVLGKDDYLYEDNFIAEYNGLDLVKDSVVRRTCYKLKRVQDTLEKLGKTFIFVISPSKAYYYPDKIPHNLLVRKPHSTNYYGFRNAALAERLNLVDFNGWFLKMKDTSRHPLITRQGIHWSLYGATLAADSILSYMTARGVAMPDLKITRLEQTTEPRSADADLGNVLNLIYPLKGDTYTYPQCAYVRNDTSRKGKLVLIGDSFCWLWLDNGMLQNTGNGWEFWYYYSIIWGDRIDAKPMKDYDPMAAIGKADCIVVMYSPLNLRLLCAADSFVSLWYQYYYLGER